MDINNKTILKKVKSKIGANPGERIRDDMSPLSATIDDNYEWRTVLGVSKDYTIQIKTPPSQPVEDHT